MALIRSLLHLLFMGITVVPWALVVLVCSLFMSSTRIYWLCAGWLRLAVAGARWLLGIRTRVTGWDNLPTGQTSAAVLLLKHQSTFETFLMPTLMPHPLAYVFKKELLQVPFFGWAMSRMDMIHIDRSKRNEAFAKVVQQGRRLMGQGVWVIMFPEGTRIERGQKGVYKSGGTRLAIETGAPILPIAVAGTRHAMAKGTFRFLPARAIAQLLEPISTTGMTLADVGTLKQQTRERIEAARRLLAAELGVRIGDETTTVTAA